MSLVGMRFGLKGGPGVAPKLDRALAPKAFQMPKMIRAALALGN